MRDYFRPFLLKNNLAGVQLSETETLNKYKTHIVWALAAGGIGYACWKAGQWHSTYKMITKKMAE